MKYLGFIFILAILRGLDATCGGYIKDANTGTITSTNYPSNYPDESNCIWLIEAINNHSLVLNITSGFAGETNCDDFLQVTNGNSALPNIFYVCNDPTPAVVYSNTRWLWVRFFSDNANNNTGFTASYSVISDPDSANALGGNTNYSSPAVDCQSVHFKCANKECISASYRCDSQYDCGCFGFGGCDEDNCGGLALSVTARICIGVTLGAVIFTCIFVGIGTVEIVMKKRSEQEYQRKVKEARLRARQKKNKEKRNDSISDRSRPSTANPLSRKNSTVVPSKV